MKKLENARGARWLHGVAIIPVEIVCSRGLLMVCSNILITRMRVIARPKRRRRKRK